MLSFLQIFIHAFRFNLNKTNNILNELSRNSYSVYIIHMIVLGVVALALMHLPVHGAIKYVLVIGIYIPYFKHDHLFMAGSETEND